MSLDKVKKLVERAAHVSTPEEEARTCAITAIKMLVASGYEIVDPKETGERGSGVTINPFDIVSKNGFMRVTPFKTGIAAKQARCVACKLKIEKGAPNAFSLDKAKPGETHFRCRGFWVDGFTY
jgi:hypothetical protein